MSVILFGNHFLKGALGFSLIGFSGQFGRVSETSHTPELISGVLNDARFYPLTAFSAVCLDLLKWCFIFRAARNFHFSSSPVDEWVYAFEPG